MLDHRGPGRPRRRCVGDGVLRAPPTRPRSRSAPKRSKLRTSPVPDPDHQERLGNVSNESARHPDAVEPAVAADRQNRRFPGRLSAPPGARATRIFCRAARGGPTGATRAGPGSPGAAHAARHAMHLRGSVSSSHNAPQGRSAQWRLGRLTRHYGDSASRDSVDIGPEVPQWRLTPRRHCRAIEEKYLYGATRPARHRGASAPEAPLWRLSESPQRRHGAEVPQWRLTPRRHCRAIEVKYLYVATRQLAIEAPQLLSCRSGIIV